LRSGTGIFGHFKVAWFPLFSDVDNVHASSLVSFFEIPIKIEITSFTFFFWRFWFSESIGFAIATEHDVTVVERWATLVASFNIILSKFFLSEFPLASADDFGFVNLYRYPSPVKEAASNKQGGHSSHVTNVKFSLNQSGDKYLVSTGGEDKCIFQWKFGQEEFGEDDIEAGDQSCPPFDDGDIMLSGDSKADTLAEPKPPKEEGEGGDFDLDGDLEEGDEAGCMNIVNIAE
jgi:WD40 repeat protein